MEATLNGERNERNPSQGLAAAPAEGASTPPAHRPRRSALRGLRYKIIVASGLPALGLILLSTWTVTDRLNAAASLKEAEQAVGFAGAAGAMVHELQRERGLSGAWLGNVASEPELAGQRAATDKSLEALVGSPEWEWASSGQWRLTLEPWQIPDGVRKLAGIRPAIDRRSMSGAEVIAAFTNVMERTLSAIDKLPRSVPEKDLSDGLVAFASLLRAKEKAGQERATLTFALADRRFDPVGYERLMGIRASEDENLRLFRTFAPPEIRDYYGQKIQGELTHEFDRLRREADRGFATGVASDPMQWFRVSTERIDLLHDVDEALSTHLRTQANSRREEALRTAATFGLLIAAAMASIALLVLWAGARLVKPLDRLVRAADRIASGEREVPIVMSGVDETATLAEAMTEMQASIARSEQRLVDAESRFRLLADSAVDALVAVDTTGTIAYANEAAGQLFGVPVGDLAGAQVASLLKAEHDGHDRPLFALATFAASPTPLSSVEVEGRRPDGARLSLEVSVSPFSAGDRPVSTWILRDITVRKLAQNELVRTRTAYERFVPRELLSLLGKQSIAEVQFGDHVELGMTVLFADLRDFTTRAERMAPGEAFGYVNSYLGLVQPCITGHGGFVDKFLGDAVLALFPGSVDDAVAAACDVQWVLGQYNTAGRLIDRGQIRAGIGVHTGPVTVGTLGADQRMDGTAIGDAVNVAARLQDLSKAYGAPVLVTGESAFSLTSDSALTMRFVDRVKVKGRAHSLSVFEVIARGPTWGDPAKRATLDTYHEGIVHYLLGRNPEAAECMQRVLASDPGDAAALLYLRRATQPVADRQAHGTSTEDATAQWHARLATWHGQRESSEHRSLLSLADLVCAHGHPGGDEAVLRTALGNIRGAMVRHCAAEEGEMVRLAFPDYPSHKSAHRGLVAALDSLMSGVPENGSGGHAFRLKAIGGLAVDLIEHMVVDDAAFATFARRVA